MKQIVISVPDEWLKGTQPNLYDVMGAVMNGTVLPEHYGRLIDADKLLRDTISNPCHAPYIVKLDVDEAETIILATKEGAE